jgi:hypothetical protein
MTPADEALFIQLWQQGASQQAIAARLGVPVGTVKSRASTLARQGKILPRPRGGAYPHRRIPAQPEGAHAPQVSSDTRVDTPPVQYLPPGQGEMLPLLHDILQELRSLTGGLAARVSTDTLGVQRDIQTDTRGVSVRTPLPVERGKSVRWNLHLSEGLRERIKAMAEARGLQDSQMVEELLWRALAVVEEQSSTTVVG